MAAAVTVSQMEMNYFISVYGIGPFSVFPELQGLEKAEQIEECEKSLKEKEYLLEVEDQKIAVLQELMAIIHILKDFEGSLEAVEASRQKLLRRFMIFFSGDGILLFENKEEEYRLVILPFLPLAIGLLSSYIATFKNKETREIMEVSVDQVTEDFSCGVDRDSVERMWGLTGINRLDKDKDCLFTIWETKEQQILWERSKDKVKITAPDKADLINTITRWMSQMHAMAMRQRGIGRSRNNERIQGEY